MSAAEDPRSAQWGRDIREVLGKVSTSKKATGVVVEYRKALLVWDYAKNAAKKQVETFKSALLSDYPELKSVGQALDGVMGQFNAGLANALDAALNAKDDDERRKHHADAQKIVNRYLESVASPIFQHLDRNPYTKLKIAATLTAALTNLSKYLTC